MMMMTMTMMRNEVRSIFAKKQDGEKMFDFLLHYSTTHTVYVLKHNYYADTAAVDFKKMIC
jgi:hypothetical protein